MPIPFVEEVSSNASPISELESLGFKLYAHAAIRRTVVTIRFPGLAITEVVWAGALSAGGAVSGAFTSRYVSTSSVAAVVHGSLPGTVRGLAFVLQRTPVWPDSPVLELYAVDVNGDEV